MPLTQNIKKAFSKFTADFIMHSKNIPNQTTDSYTSVKESSTVSPDIGIVEKDFKSIFKNISQKFNIFNKLNDLEKNSNSRVNKRDVKNSLYIKEIIESYYAEAKEEHFKKDNILAGKNKIEELEEEIARVESEIEREENLKKRNEEDYAKILNLFSSFQFNLSSIINITRLTN